MTDALDRCDRHRRHHRQPDVSFGVVDWAVDAPNATYVTFASEEQGYLAGAAAALRSETGRIGFVLAADVEFLADFRAGVDAGATSIDPDVEILTSFIDDSGSPEGFFQPEVGQLRAGELYEQGADVIVSAAGSSDFGTFAAAAQYSAATDTQVWAIGLDNDQWFAVPANQQSVIATSIIKRVDVGAYRLIEHMLDGGEPGEAFRLRVVDDAYDISTQGDGLTTEMSNTLQAIRADIADGTIEVPTASQ